MNTRYKLWKFWKKNYNGPLIFKIMVLLGWAHSPTFEFLMERKELIIGD